MQYPLLVRLSSSILEESDRNTAGGMSTSLLVMHIYKTILQYDILACGINGR